MMEERVTIRWQKIRWSETVADQRIDLTELHWKIQLVSERRWWLGLWNIANARKRCRCLFARIQFK